MTVPLGVADPITGIAHLLGQPYLARAFVAGTVIAASAGLVGYFVVLRRQVFTGDALSHVAFSGAMAALAVGVDLRIGLFASCVALALAMAGLGRQGRADDVVIGTVFAWVLGLGVLFLSLYTSDRSTGNGVAGVSVLFGSIFGLSTGQATLAVIIGAAVMIAVLAMARPLLFASIDEAVAAARGIPVRILGLAFLALVGITAGEATQAVGALLLLGLLAAPAAAAQRLTDRPYAGLLLSAVIAVSSVWFGLALAYAAPRLPPSFTILLVSSAAYLAAGVWSGPVAEWRRLRRLTRSVGQLTAL